MGRTLGSAGCVSNRASFHDGGASSVEREREIERKDWPALCVCVNVEVRAW